MVPRTSGDAIRLLCILSLLACIVALARFGARYPQAGMEVAQIFLTGWLSFLRYASAHIALEWDGIGLALICAAVALGGLHWLGRWLSEQMQASWTWRSTVTGSLAVCWLFVLTITSGGLGRSVYALIFAPEGNVSAQGIVLKDAVFDK